jgi:hypothetical protein
MNATHRATRRAIGVEARRPRCNFLHRRNANHDTASHTVNTGLRRRDRGEYFRFVCSGKHYCGGDPNALGIGPETGGLNYQESMQYFPAHGRVFRAAGLGSYLGHLAERKHTAPLRDTNGLRGWSLHPHASGPSLSSYLQRRRAKT